MTGMSSTTAAATLHPWRSRVTGIPRQPCVRLFSSPRASLREVRHFDRLSFSKRTSRAHVSAMQANLPSSPPTTPKSANTLWTARLIATLWKLAVKRARKLRRQSHSAAKTDIMYGSAIDLSSQTAGEKLDETSIMREAALSVVASGIISLADLEAVTGYRLSKNHDGEMPLTKDDDASSEAATELSDCCSIADGDVFESMLYEEFTVCSPVTKLRAHHSLQSSFRRAQTSPSKSAKWVCVGYGRYVKVQE